MRQPEYKRYLLTLLTSILVFNYLDRIALGLLLQNIKSDLHLTDTQLGVLGGIAFALFYAVMGLPIARWADRGDRRVIITLTTTLWSVMVMLCGTAASFAQLVLIRVGVAVGEAGCIPPAFSLIADYFERAERPRAAAIYGMGGPLSSLVGFFVAGWLNEFYGWRVAFVALGAPGLALAAIAWTTLRETRRFSLSSRTQGMMDSAAARPVELQPGLREVARTLWKNVTFRRLVLCLSVMFFFLYGILQWQPTFLIRSFKLHTGEVGTWLAAIYGIGGLLGSYLGGDLASRYAANDERAQLRLIALSVCLAGVLSASAYLAPNEYEALILMGLATLGVSMANGPLFATIQTLVPESMRAVAFARVYLFANLIGMGFGPLTVGALSDLLHPLVGQESLRYALLAMAPGYLCVAWQALRASTTVADDVLLATEGSGSIDIAGTRARE